MRNLFIWLTSSEKEFKLKAILDKAEAFKEADFIVVAAPTNYDAKKNFFDTEAVEEVIKNAIEINPKAFIVNVVARAAGEEKSVVYRTADSCIFDYRAGCHLHYACERHKRPKTANEPQQHRNCAARYER